MRLYVCHGMDVSVLLSPCDIIGHTLTSKLVFSHLHVVKPTDV